MGDLLLPNRIVMVPITGMRAANRGHARFAAGAPLADLRWETAYASGPEGHIDYPKLEAGVSPWTQMNQSC